MPRIEAGLGPGAVKKTAADRYRSHNLKKVEVQELNGKLLKVGTESGLRK